MIGMPRNGNSEPKPLLLPAAGAAGRVPGGGSLGEQQGDGDEQTEHGDGP